MLNGYDAAGRETPAVANAVDLVKNGNRGVPGSQEIGVERMGAAIGDGTAGGNQGLGEDLPAEDPLPILLGAATAEKIDFDGLEVEQVENGL